MYLNIGVFFVHKKPGKQQIIFDTRHTTCKFTEDERGFNRLAQAHFVGQQHPFNQRRAQRKHGRLDLVRVQVHAGVKKRLAQTIEPTACVLQGPVMRDVFGLVGGEQQDDVATGRGYELKDSYRNVLRPD